MAGFEQEWWPSAADGRAVWRLAWPMIVSNVSVPLLGLVDAAILGHLPDARYLAAVAVGTTLFGFLYWGFGFLRMGTTGLVAQAWGRAADTQRDSSLRLLLAQGIVLGGLIGALVLILSTPLLSLGFGALAPPAEVLAEAWRYCGIRVWSAPAVLATYALLGFLVGAQDTRSVLAVMVTTNLANIVLDLTLVLGFGMRTDGVAAATAVSEYLGLALAAWLAWRRCATLGGNLSLPALLRIDAYRALLAVNGHLFVRTLCLLGTMAFFTAQGARQGEEILAANALLLNLLMLVSFGLDGFAHAAEALTGRAVGGGRPADVARTVFAAGGFSLLTALAFSLLFAGAGDLLLDALTDLPAVATAAHAYLPWLAGLPMLAVWCFLFDGIFIGATRTRAMRDTMIAATALVFLPIWALTRDFGNSGLWLAFDAFFVARGIGLGVSCWREARLGRWFVPAPN